MWAGQQEQPYGQLYIFSTLCTTMHKAHTLEPVSKTACVLIPKRGIRTHNEQREWCVPMWCDWYRGQAMLWRSFIGTTPTITERVYSVFQSSDSTQLGISQHGWIGWWYWEWARSPDKTGTKISVDTALSPYKKIVVHTFTAGRRGKNDS